MTQMPGPPANVPPLDPARQAAMRELIELAVAADARRPSRARVPVAVGLGATVALAGGTAAAIVLTQEPVRDTGLVHCFARAELDSDGSYPGTAIAAGTPRDEPVSVTDAVGACAQVWRTGILDPSAEIGAPLPDPDQAGRAPVPAELSVCVMPDGAAAVVPGSPAACAELGLPLREEPSPR
jgi:hypothetical protein